MTIVKSFANMKEQESHQFHNTKLQTMTNIFSGGPEADTEGPKPIANSEFVVLPKLLVDYILIPG